MENYELGKQYQPIWLFEIKTKQNWNAKKWKTTSDRLPNEWCEHLWSNKLTFSVFLICKLSLLLRHKRTNRQNKLSSDLGRYRIFSTRENWFAQKKKTKMNIIDTKKKPKRGKNSHAPIFNLGALCVRECAHLQICFPFFVSFAGHHTIFFIISRRRRRRRSSIVRPELAKTFIPKCRHATNNVGGIRFDFRLTIFDFIVSCQFQFRSRKTKTTMQTSLIVPNIALYIYVDFAHLTLK